MTIEDQADGSRAARPAAGRRGQEARPAGRPDSQDMTGVWFPRLAARDLDGCEVALPAGLPGEWNVVIVAFRREQQDLVDSSGCPGWLNSERPPTLGSGSSSCQRSGCAGSQPPSSSTVESRRPSPTRRTRRRTWDGCTPTSAGNTASARHYRPQHDLAVPGGPGRPGALARPQVARTRLRPPPSPPRSPNCPASCRGAPGSGSRGGAVRDGVRSPFPAAARRARGHPRDSARDPHTRPPDRLFRALGVRTAPSNVRAVSLTGPYHWYRAIGPRLSLADHGLTFGTTTTRGVCLQLRDPVPGIDPIGLIRHPNLTLTVADPAALRRRHAPLRRDRPRAHRTCPEGRIGGHKRAGGGEARVPRTAADRPQAEAGAVPWRRPRLAGLIRDRAAAGTASLFSHGAHPLARTLNYPGDPGLFGPGR